MTTYNGTRYADRHGTMYRPHYQVRIAHYFETKKPLGGSGGFTIGNDDYQLEPELFNIDIVSYNDIPIHQIHFDTEEEVMDYLKEDWNIPKSIYKGTTEWEDCD